MKNIHTFIFAASTLLAAGVAQAQAQDQAADGSATGGQVIMVPIPGTNPAVSSDPLVVKRQADSDANAEYKARKKGAKMEMKEEKADAKVDMKIQKSEAKNERDKAMAADPAP
jgi:FlaG/FlaF family flagellin (archaellin)